MKQNTKFLWMYVGILFSFALILVIFAGFSRNTVTEQKEGLQSDVAYLSAQNTNLKNEVASLRTQIDKLMSEKESKQSADTSFLNTETLISQAYGKYRAGKKTEARTLLSSLDRLSLTDTQRILYDIIMD